ncbi:hypothetical protein TRFO_25413 [Tritrichomonas foetus]|uniref:PAS domain-containing protein n=1 Tax=Tritrichomonas foetus TaxID=1144522 RepID=A0A1J4K509_9EUKA|nr:hypothetical protein TRFO_25413 [Tritrichomonas foetus]|eukprot:OHT06529.1 hypothetical protein TRFO_25413 [Tritrichomonas foetus]
MNHDGILMEDTSHHSQRSMSLSSSASDIANDTVGSSSLDHLFPFFDEITRTAPQKMGSSVIMIFIIFLEAFTNGYFPFLPDFWNLNEQPDKILRYFAYLLDFGNSDESVLKTYVPSIVILALSYMIFFWFLGIVQYYRINKTFSRASIIATRILFSFILPFLLIPNMNSIGFNFNAIFYAQSGSHSAYIALTVLSVISGAINYFLFYFDIIFRSSTPYLENSCFSMWDGKPFFTFVLVQGLAAFSSRLLFHFPAWTKYFLVALYGVVNLVMALNCFVFHFIPEICNISLAAMHMTNLLSAVFAVCPISSTIRLIIPIPIFIVMQSVFYFLFKMTRKKAIELLPTKLEEQALMTMRIVMADDPKSFVDWTLIRQITALHPTTNVFIRIAQVLSFFPSESQLLNHYVMIISKHSDLKLHERFMFYQIRRVHVLRQSSANKQFNFEFEEVKKQTSKMIACFSQFFVTNNELSIGTLIGLVKLNKKTNSLCNEALEKYPNSSRLAYEYSRYLIECHAEFKEGTAWYNKAEQMDTGKHTAIYYSFRSMVNLYPVYLKKNILDYKGKKIITVEKTKAGSSASSLTGNNGNVDEEANEELAERIFDKPRLRFALKRATDNMKCVPLELIYEGSVVRYILTFIVFISLYFGFQGFFNGRLDNTVLMESVATVREVIAVGLVSLCHLVGTAFGAIDQIYIKEETAEYDILNNTAQSMILGIINGIKATQTLGSMIASHGSSIIETAREYMIDGKINYCFDNGTIMDATFVSTRSLSYYLLTHLLNAQSAISPTMSKTSVICELIGNVPTFQEQMDKQTVLFTTREASTADEINHKLDIAFILVPIALAICLLSPLVIGLLLLHKDLKRLFSAVMLLPRDVFVQGSKPIVKTDFDSSTVASSIEMDRTPVFGIPIVVICSMIISVVSVTMVLLMIRDTNNNFMNAALWLETSARRGPFLIELVSDAYFLAFFQISQSTTYGNVSEKAHRVKQNLDVVMKLNRDLLLGNDEMPACNGFSKELDEIHFSSSCSEEYEEYGLHGNYNCLSVDQLMMVYSKFTEDLLSTFTSNPMYPVGKTDPFNQLAHLVFYHIFPNLQRVQVILSDACQNLIKDTNVTNGVILIISFLIITILFIIELLMNHKMDAAYNTLKIIIARFPPNAVISNQNLLDAIIGRAQMKRVKQVSAAQSVIDSSPDAIFALSGDYSIESMNPAASHIFGYTPEQILGQSITTLIPNPDADKDPLVLTNNNTESSLYR